MPRRSPLGVVAIGNWLRSTDLSGSPRPRTTRGVDNGTPGTQRRRRRGGRGCSLAFDGRRRRRVGGGILAAARWRGGRRLVRRRRRRLAGAAGAAERTLRAVARVADVAQKAILTPVRRAIGGVRLAARYRSRPAKRSPAATSKTPSRRRRASECWSATSEGRGSTPARPAALGLGGAVTVDSIPLSPATRVLLHTDGLLAARSSTGRFLGIAAVVATSVHRCDDKFLDEVLARVDTDADR